MSRSLCRLLEKTILQVKTFHHFIIHVFCQWALQTRSIIFPEWRTFFSVNSVFVCHCWWVKGLSPGSILWKETVIMTQWLVMTCNNLYIYKQSLHLMSKGFYFLSGLWNSIQKDKVLIPIMLIKNTKLWFFYRTRFHLNSNFRVCMKMHLKVTKYQNLKRKKGLDSTNRDLSFPMEFLKDSRSKFWFFFQYERLVTSNLFRW